MLTQEQRRLFEMIVAKPDWMEYKWRGVGWVNHTKARELAMLPTITAECVAYYLDQAKGAPQSIKNPAGLFIKNLTNPDNAAVERFAIKERRRHLDAAVRALKAKAEATDTAQGDDPFLTALKADDSRHSTAVLIECFRREHPALAAPWSDDSLLNPDDTADFLHWAWETVHGNAAQSPPTTKSAWDSLPADYRARHAIMAGRSGGAGSFTAHDNANPDDATI
jgi:hypothetical protein